MDDRIDPLFITVEEAAKRLNLGRTHVFRLLKDGTIPSVKLGRSRRISVRALKAWAESVASAESK